MPFTGARYFKPPISLINRSSVTLTRRRISNNALYGGVVFANILSSHSESLTLNKRLSFVHKEHTG